MRAALVPLGLVLVFVASAHAQDAGVTAPEWLARAQAAEDRAEPAEALEAWRQLIEVAPASRLAGRARARIAWMQARSEGDYAPLRAMMAFLALAPAARGEAVVAAFDRVTNEMPEGRVRAESRLAVGGEWARLGETERALAAWQLALDDPRLAPDERDLVRESMARARMDAGDLAGAIDGLDDANLGGLSIHETATRRLRAATWVPIAYGLFGTFVLLVLGLVIQSGRVREIALTLEESPLRIVIALAVGLGPLAIVWWWGDDSLGAFEAFAPCSFAIVLLSFLAGEATERADARVAVGVMAIVAALATAYASVALCGEALPFA